MNARAAAIKREAHGETIRWQASPRPRFRFRLLSWLSAKDTRRRKLTFVLTDRRLFSIEERGEGIDVRSADVGQARELLADRQRLLGGDPGNAQVRLIQDLELYCTTSQRNAFKRALDRIR